MNTKWLSCVIILDLIRNYSHIYGIDPLERTTIEYMYKNQKKTVARRYNEYKEFQITSVEYDPCFTYFNSRPKMKEMEVDNLVLELLVSRILYISLDGETEFHSPALFNCTAKWRDEERFTYYLIFKDTTTSDAGLLRVLPDQKENNPDKKLLFTAYDVIIAREIYTSYTDNRDEMKTLYEEQQVQVTSNYTTCENAVTSKSTNVIIITGDISVGNFLLLINEKQSINLPGVLKCTTYIKNQGMEFAYFILVRKNAVWQQIHDAKIDVNNYERVFAFEEFLVNKV